MTFKQRLAAAFDGFIGKRSAGVNDYIQWLEENAAGRTLYFQELRTVEAAIARNPYVRRAFEIIVSLVSTLPIEVQDKDNEVLEGTLFQKIMLKPNDAQSWQMFLRETTGYALSCGRFGWLVTKDGSGKIVMLDNLDGEAIRPKLSDGARERITGYTYQGQNVPFEEVVYNYWWTPDSGKMGDSPLASALEVIAASVAITRVIRSLAENSQRPGGLIVPKERLDDDAYNKLVRAFNKKYAPDNAGYYDVMPVEVDIRSAVISPHEGQLNETQDRIKTAIYVATGISQVLLESGTATYENQDIATKNMWKLTLMPIILMIQEKLTEVIQTYDDSLKMVFNLADVEALKPELNQSADIVTKLKGYISRDEGREILGKNFEPLLEGGDEVPDQASMMPVGIAPPVKSKQKKPSRMEQPKTAYSSAWDIVRDKLNESKTLSTRQGYFENERNRIYFTERTIELSGYVRSFKKELSSLYVKQKNKVLAIVEKANEDLVDLGSPQEWIDWKNEERVFAKMAHPRFSGIVKDAAKKINSEFKLTGMHMEHIREHTKRFSEESNETTITKISEAVEESKRQADDGISMRKEEEKKKTPKSRLLEILLGVYLWSEGARALSAATTETHSAQGYGITEGIVSSGTKKQQWLTHPEESKSGESRPAHEIADGMVVEAGKPFLIGGEYLMYPGDINASPENRCNCNCQVIPYRDD